VLSLTHEQIVQRIDACELDCGVTYLAEEELKGFNVLPLYSERYVLLARDASQIGGRLSLEWNSAADLPLCLLTPNMQNRRIIDAAFRQAGVAPKVLLETDSIFAVYSHVRHAGLFSVVPHSMLWLFEMRQEVSAIRLLPELSRPIGLVVSDRKPRQPVLGAAWSVFANLNLQPRFDALINDIY
jgi:DNA-binding transcriptional LysR family regulator